MPVTKDHVLYDFVYVQNRQIYRDKKYISGCLGLERGGIGVSGGVTAHGYRLYVWGHEKVLKLMV